MRCESLGPRLSAWVDGELPMLSAWLVARHVATCPACAAEVEELRALNAQLAAANPVLDPLLTPVFKPARRISPPLVGAGALMAAGVAGFFLLPRLPEPVSNTNSTRPAFEARVALKEKDALPQEGARATELKQSPAALPAPAKKSPPPAKPARVAAAPERPVSREGARRRTGRAKQSFRRSAPKATAELSTPRARKPATAPSAEAIKVAHADKADLTLNDAMRINRTKDIAAPVAEPDAELLRMLEKMPSVAPITPPVTVNEGGVDAVAKKRDERMSFGAARPRAITSAKVQVESQDSAAPRKKVVPVLVVTPTRYENVVTVTAGALEVDDTDDKEETPQP